MRTLQRTAKSRSRAQGHRDHRGADWPARQPAVRVWALRTQLVGLPRVLFDGGGPRSSGPNSFRRVQVSAGPGRLQWPRGDLRAGFPKAAQGPLELEAWRWGGALNGPTRAAGLLFVVARNKLDPTAAKPPVIRRRRTRGSFGRGSATWLLLRGRAGEGGTSRSWVSCRQALGLLVSSGRAADNSAERRRNPFSATWRLAGGGARWALGGSRFTGVFTRLWARQTRRGTMPHHGAAGRSAAKTCSCSWDVLPGALPARGWAWPPELA